MKTMINQQHTTFRKATVMDGANSWVNDTEVPDPTTLPVLLQDAAVLIRPIGVKNKIGSIELPDSVKSDLQYLQNIGTVIGLSQALKDDPDFNALKVGDIVAWQKFTGQKLLYNDNGHSYKLIILDYRDVMIKIDNFDRLDPTYSIQRF